MVKNGNACHLFFRVPEIGTEVPRVTIFRGQSTGNYRLTVLFWSGRRRLNSLFLSLKSHVYADFELVVNTTTNPSPTTILIMNELRVKIVARFIFVVILLFTAIYPQKPRITTTNNYKFLRGNYWRFLGKCRFSGGCGMGTGHGGTKNNNNKFKNNNNKLGRCVRLHETQRPPNTASLF